MLKLAEQWRQTVVNMTAVLLESFLQFLRQASRYYKEYDLLGKKNYIC